MTVAVILAGLIPIVFGHGAGSEVMSRIAAPMIGGIIALVIVVGGVALLLTRRRRTATADERE